MFRQGMWIFLLPLIAFVQSAIHEYKNVELPRDALMFRRGGMYGPDDTPQAKGQPSYIKVDLTLEREESEYQKGEVIKVQLAVFDQEVWDNGLGVKLNDKDGKEEHIFCCTPELVQKGHCETPLTLILKEDVSAGTYIHDIEFVPSSGDSSTTPAVKVMKKFEIPYKGLKYLLFASCNDITGNVRINGQTEWHNPFGYLPGEFYGSLDFFLQLAIVYIIIGTIWAIACARHWRELMILQNYVTIVLALGMMEMALRYYDFQQFNVTGTRGTGLMLWSSVLHTSKQTVSRLLVLVVSMGFGIVKPSLGDSFNTVAGLGGLFFFFAVVQRVYELSSHISAITFMQYVTMLPVAALDLVFFLWIIRSLNDIIAQLESREQGVKLTLYKRFRLVLFVTMVIASIWSLTFSFIVVSGKISADWESRWIFDGFFDVLYLLVLTSIMILWRPTNNSTQFAYSKVTNRDVDDDEEYGNGLEEDGPTPPPVPPKTYAAAAAAAGTSSAAVVDSGKVEIELQEQEPSASTANGAETENKGDSKKKKSIAKKKEKD